MSRRGLVKGICKVCRKYFIARKGQQFCSIQCAGKSKFDRIIKKCKICNKEFITHPCKIRKGFGKFCSRKCKHIDMLGKSTCIKSRKGVHSSPKTEFKKGLIPWNKGKSHLPGKESGSWKGGKTIRQGGYIYIHTPNHPFKKQNYVFEHRLVMEKHIGRHLDPKEVVHHINGNPSDNRLENLMLFANNAEHKKFHHLASS